MLIDMHAHSSGISRCCRYDAKTVLQHAKEIGIDGIVLTNHYQADYIINGDTEEFIKRYYEEYLLCKKYGDEIDMKVFFGVEVTVSATPNVHLLIYGADEKFLLQNPMLFDMSLKALHILCRENGCALVQAHPFRNKSTIMDTRYLDGLELNCHPLYDGTHRDELAAKAKAENLMLTCGGDYHGDTYRANCGTYLPDSINDHRDIAEFILKESSVKLRIQEPHEKVYEEQFILKNSV